MRHRTVRPVSAVALVLAAGIAVGGCATATATTGDPAGSASAAASSATASGVASGAGSTASGAGSSASAPVVGPVADPACAAALKAKQVLEKKQGKDQANESALDQDLTNFANALNTAAQEEKNPGTAKAMTALANDYTALVASQSGAQQLPDMSTVQSDGAAFDKACGLSVAPGCPPDISPTRPALVHPAHRHGGPPWRKQPSAGVAVTPADG